MGQVYNGVYIYIFMYPHVAYLYTYLHENQKSTINVPIGSMYGVHHIIYTPIYIELIVSGKLVYKYRQIYHT